MKIDCKVLAIVTSLITLNACFKLTAKDGGRRDGIRISQEDGEIEEPVVSLTIGIKNAEQILNSMMTVTGIDPNVIGGFGNNNSFGASNNNRSITRVYNEDYKGILPGTNDIGGFNTNAQIAVVKLAFSFCDALGGRGENANNTPPNLAAARASVLGTDIIARLNTEGLIPTVRSSLIIPMLDKFWGAGMIAESIRANAESDLEVLAEEIGMSQVRGGRARGRDVVKAVCVAALSSSPVVLY